MNSKNSHFPSPPAGNRAWGWREVGLLIVGLLLLPVGMMIPVDTSRHPGSGLDAEMVRIGLGVFLCIAFLWVTEALPLAVTALLVPVLGVLMGVMDPKSAMTGFADPLIFLFLGGFALAAALAAQGLDRWIAHRIVRAGRGGFLRVSLLIFATTAGISMWMSNTATTALMIPLVLGILGHLDPKERSPSRTAFILLGTAYASSIGGLGTLVGTPPNGIAAAKLGIDFMGWLKFGIPCVLVLLPLMTLVLMGMFRPGKAQFAIPEIANFTWSRGRVLTMAVFFLTGMAWVSGGALAPMLGVANSFDTVVALLAIVVLVAMRLVGWKEIEHGTEWGVLLLFGGGIVLSNILDKTGASLFMAREIVVLVDGWPVVLVIGAALLFVILLGEFASNTATAALMVPIFFSVAGELGLAPAKLVIPMALAASCGFMLPVATPPNAMVFATGRIRQADMLRAGLVLDLVSLVAVTLLAWWFF
jgi:sodium-dependent dicarboxylate transporter 2/3/5